MTKQPSCSNCYDLSVIINRRVILRFSSEVINCSLMFD